MPRFVAKSVTSKRLSRPRAQEAWVLVRGYLVPEDRYKKAKFIAFMRDTKFVKFVREQSDKSMERRKKFPR